MPVEQRREKVESGAHVSKDALKTGAEGAAKGGIEAAETVSHFQYAPTLIALFPVFASFFFGSHTEHWTDLILLGLVAVYLHNCVTVPWEYYKASRKRYKSSNVDKLTSRQKEVSRQLGYAEAQAFGGLILGPLIGAGLLHFVRSTMARPANGLITNFNITVFVLAAELRPLKISYEYLSARSERLQQDLIDVVPARYDELLDRLAQVEHRLVENGRVQQGRAASDNNRAHLPLTMGEEGERDIVQMKHALRRFERHEAQIQQQYEEKLHAMERRLADIGRDSPLSSGQRSPSIVRSLASLMVLPARLFWAALTFPARLGRWLGRTTKVSIAS